MVGMPVASTPYDLRFQVLGIPVRVHPLFWLVSWLLGGLSNDIRWVLMWIACVFVSILVHELGHGLMARAFRYSPSIVLYGMGGLCYSEAERQTPGQRLAVLISGPGAGFLLLGLLWGGYFGASHLLDRQPLGRAGLEVLGIMTVINLFWGILNLLPIWPLDGGQIAGVLLTLLNRRNGMRWAHVISLVAAGVLAMAAWRFGGRDPFYVIFFAYFAFINYQVLHALHQSARYSTFDNDSDWWKR